MKESKLMKKLTMFQQCCCFSNSSTYSPTPQEEPKTGLVIISVDAPSSTTYEQAPITDHEQPKTDLVIISGDSSSSTTYEQVPSTDNVQVSPETRIKSGSGGKHH